MIELVLIFPVIACIVLFFTKSVKLNTLSVLFYAFLQVFAWSEICFKGNFSNDTYNIFSFYFQVDNLNILFLLLLSLVFLAVAVYNLGFVKSKELSGNNLKYYSMAMFIFILSMTCSILSTNLALSWVFIEATTLASAYLIYFNKTKHSIEAAWKYVFICSIGIALAFVGIILLTIATGKLNSLFFVDLYANASTVNPLWMNLSFVFILIGIGTKMGLAPMHFWLPDAHSEAPSPISALLSATLLNSAFLIILRVFKILKLAHIEHYAQNLLIIMGLLSLFVAAVFIYNANNYKRMLAYSSIENMGILAIGTAFGGAGLFAALLHMVGHSLIKSTFFLTAGNILKIFKTKKINKISGLLKIDAKTGWLWILCFTGIMAFPPSPLFISEFLLMKILLLQNNFVILSIILILLTIILFGMAKVVINMSFGECSEEDAPNLHPSLYIPQIFMITIFMIIGIWIPPFLYSLISKAVSGF